MKLRLLLFPAFAAAAACVPAPQPQSTPAALPGERLVQAKCSTCHSLGVALAGVRSEAEWASVLDQMVGHGMEASEEELKAMRTYLAQRRPGK